MVFFGIVAINSSCSLLGLCDISGYPVPICFPATLRKEQDWEVDDGPFDLRTIISAMGFGLAGANCSWD